MYIQKIFFVGVWVCIGSICAGNEIAPQPEAAGNLICSEISHDLTATQTTMFRDVIERLKEQYELAARTGIFNAAGFFVKEQNPDQISDLALSTLKDECNAHVKTISLENNNLHDAPLICKFVELENLFLSGNSFGSLPKGLGDLKQLEYLEANRCGLKRYPNEVNNIHGLKKLFLQENKIFLVPAAIRKLEKLEELDLSYNKIVDLPDSIGELTKLEVLKLNNNRLTSLPMKLEKLKFLNFISVYGNPLDKEAIELLVRLQKKKVTVYFTTSPSDNLDH